MKLSELLGTWRSRHGANWSSSPQEYQSLAEKILARGEALLAYDVTVEGLTKWPEAMRLRQLQALALARSGAIERANVMLEELRQSTDADEETIGMLARTYKDLASRAGSKGNREHFLRRAADTYLQAYQANGGYWTGINAATMSLLIDERQSATDLAAQVQKLCQEALSSEGADHYWLLAALGEAALIRRQWQDAEKWYQRAKEQAGRRFADLGSSRRNARLILQYWKQSDIELDRYVAVPPVVVFAGHMLDTPDRVVPRFPAALETVVARGLRTRIEQLKPGFGFAAAACGSDILFLEAMLEIGAEVSVVLPYNKDQFVRDSVDLVPGTTWRARFERVIEHAAQYTVASTQKLELGSVSYEFGNQLLFGLATIHAQRLDTSLIPLAVWDGSAGDAPGGTASAVEMWRSRGYTPEIISLPQTSTPIEEDAGTKSSKRTSPECDPFTSRIVAILFADAVGFSRLAECEVPQFVKHFLGSIASLAEKFGRNMVARNTWGDGLYFVITDMNDAGQFALELADMISTIDWREKGLRSDLSVRIALHAGPVYEFDDPITANRSYSGTHVSRAARIEPITPAGHVYASEAFAALAAARGGDSFVCDYVGQTPLAKDYGTLPMYHVRWR